MVGAQVKLLAYFRTFFISPEMIAFLFPFALMPHATFLDDLALVLRDHKFEMFVASVYPFAVLVYAAGQAGNLISPVGKRSVLLEWPDYSELKRTIYLSVALISLSLLLSVGGYITFVVDEGRLGLTAMVSGAVSSTVSGFTLVLAHWKSREIIGE